jgi:uncharacterized protein involved in cysteine biosynthesis
MWHAFVGACIVLTALGIGVVGYRVTEGLSWIDSLLNASMILGGMGEIAPLNTAAGKLFASVYSLFAGLVFLVTVGFLMAPLAHRVLHRLHLEEDTKGPLG